MIKLSIITITKDNSKELALTLDSIFSQTYKKHVELIIVNGGKPIIQKNIKSKDLKIIIKQDKSSGIYGAMNLGSEVAKGNHVLYLNAGDKLNNNKVLENLNKYPLSRDCSYFFICKVVGKIKSWYIPNNEKRIISGDSSVPVHQSILFNKKFYKKQIYNTKYKIAADYEYKILLLKKNKVNFIPYLVADHKLGGVSSNYNLDNYLLIAKELFHIDRLYQGLGILIINQVNLFVKFIFFQTKLNKFTEIILCKIYSNRAYEIKI